MSKRRILRNELASAAALCSCLAALAIAAGCTRAEASPAPQEERCSAGCTASSSGQLVLDWNTTLFEIAKRTDEHAEAGASPARQRCRR